MGLPVIDINFKQLAESAVQRSTRGTVALLLEDATENGVMMDTYTSVNSIPTTGAWTAANIQNIKMTLMSGASKVMAVRVQSDGESASDYTATLNRIKGMDWDWAAAPSAIAANVAKIVEWIKDERANGYTHKAVVGDAVAPDSEGIVNLTTGAIESNVLGGGAQTYTATAYSPRIAGLLAGTALTQSVTGYVLEDVIGAEQSATPDADIDGGKLIIRFNGSKYEIARGVTALTSASSTPALFKKIKHVEGADLLCKDLKSIFVSRYKGKKVNSYANKQSLVAEYIAYFGELEGSVLSPDYDNVAAVDFDAHKACVASSGQDVSTMTDIEILQANTGEAVFVQAQVQLIDAMEDLYMNIILN